ncbi:penicillin acylase family protein, partial [Acinetobacter baumannii]
LPTFYLIPLLLTTLYLTPYSSDAQFNAKQIDIIRDTYGVPHIFGKTDPEVAYGLAWAHAEDDFETIQQSLMAGKAMLAQYQGKKGA